MLFFSKWQGLDFLKRVSREGKAADYVNVDGFIAGIIAEGKATLQELRTIYSLEDAFIIWESIIIPKYNEYLAAEEIKKATK